MAIAWLAQLRARLAPYLTRAPRGVRVVRPSDGRSFPCKVLREPQGDSEGRPRWTAIPLDEEYAWRFGDTLQVDVLRGRAIVFLTDSPLWRAD